MLENGNEGNGGLPEIDRPLTIVLVMDTIGNQGNGTSNSALQYAHELERQGHHVRLVGIGAPEYPVRVNKVPLVSWVAAKQQMQFAEPSETLFRTAFAGADVVHIYLPFKFGRCAAKVARRMGIAVTAGFHLQPENVTYSAGPIKYIPGISNFLYALFRHWLYRNIGHIHVPTEMIAGQLRAHGYTAKLHVISNGYVPRFTPKRQRRADAPAPVPFRIVASGRLSHEKDHITLIKAIARCRHAKDIELTICGTGPLRRYLRFRAKMLLSRPASIGFHKNAEMPALLRSCDLFGEAVVFTNHGAFSGTPKHFLTLIKQHGALLAKGWLLGLQFDTLFTDDLYQRIARNANTAADRIRAALTAKGYTLTFDAPTNQIFITLDQPTRERLEAGVRLGFMEQADDTHTVMRICTSWSTTDEQVDELLALL